MGEVLRVRGEYDAADDAFEHAVAYGHDPQPLLALLWLAPRPDRRRAAAAVRRLLAEPADAVHRVQYLAVASEVLLADGALDDAAAAAAELTVAAEKFGVPALLARAAHATGQRRARAWRTGARRTAAAPCRAAVDRSSTRPTRARAARVLVGRALRDLGDEDSALAEIDRGAAGLRRGGRASRRAAAASLLMPLLAERADRPGDRGAPARGQRARSNPEIAADLVLSEKTVARHLCNIFTKLDVRSRTAAAAFAFEHHLT